MPLDRASTLRKDKTWLQTKLQADSSHFYFYWRGRFLYFEQELFVFTQAEDNNVLGESFNTPLISLVIEQSSVSFLGTKHEQAYFVCALAFNDDAEVEQWIFRLGNSALKFLDFRRSLTLLKPKTAATLSYAKALIHWQQSTRFCGCCGNKTHAIDGGHRLVCTIDSCQKEHFPRTDPAVIMLVEYKPKTGPAVCLLAEHHRTPEKVFSTLAGFVEPGESLQEAVIREVFEEAGINVTNVNFIDSQPWPFPNSLMIGFIAEADSMALCLEDEELRSADWFSAEQLLTFADWGAENDLPKLPRKESIARLLIDSWCKKQLEAN